MDKNTQAQQQKLQSTNEQLNLVLESINDGFFVLETKDLKVKYFNKVAEKLLGRKAEDVLNKPLFEAFPEATNSVFETNYRKAFDEKTSLKFETYFGIEPYSNWYSVNVNYSKDRLSVFFQVITDIKKSQLDLQAANQQLAANEQQLRASNQQLAASESRLRAAKEQAEIDKRYFQTILNKMGDPVFVKDDQSRLLLANDAFCELFDLDRSVIIGKTLAEDVAPEEKESFLKIDKAVISTGKENISEETLTIRGGQTKTISTRKTRFVDAQGNKFLIGVIRDISERKKAENELQSANQQLSANEQQLRAANQQLNASEQQIKASENKIRSIINNSPFPVAVVDLADENIFFWSKSAIEIFGHNPKTTEEWYDLAYPDPAYRNEVIERWKPFLKEAEKSDQAIYTGEYNITCKDGSVKICELYAQFISNNLIVTLNDITDDKAAEQKLLVSKKTAEKYLNVVSEIIISLDVNGNITLLNDSGHTLLGYKRNELIGKNWFDTCLPHELLKEIKVVLKKIINGEIKNLEHVENNVITKDGKLRTILWHNTILKDDAGNITGLLSSGNDITERKKAKQALEESEAKYRNLFEALDDALLRADRNGNIFMANSAASKMFGYSSPEELKGIHMSKLYASPADRDKMLNTLNDKGAVRNFEIELVTKQGKVFWSSSNIKFLKRDDEIIGTEGLIRDISSKIKAEEKLRLSQERLQNTFDLSPSIIAKANLQSGHFIEANHAVTKILGYTIEEFISTPFMELIHPDDRLESKEEKNEQINGKEVVSFENRYLCKDRTYKWIAWFGTKADKNGIVTAVGTDITERKVAETKLKSAFQQLQANEQQLQAANQQLSANEQQLRATNQQLIAESNKLKAREEELTIAKEKAEESDRLKSAFLSNMSHEIRTPMNGILGFTNLLKKPQLSGDQKEKYIQIIEKSGKRMLATINDIIDISKIEARQVEVSEKELSINELLYEQFNFFAQEADNKQLEINYNPIVPDSDSNVISDKHKLEGILTNLIKNAIKFTESGSITFGCKLKAIKGKDVCEFFVKDTGIGIPANRIDAIFNRFEQADLEDIRVFQGSGLGLAIAKSYVEMLGGKIGVKSIEGKGSTFSFYIPYTKPTNKEALTKQNRKEGSEPLLENLSIIIAEDDDVSKLLLETIFESEHNELLFAATGKECIDLCKKNPDTDIILMDIRMPDINGLDATKEIRKFNQNVIIIAQTAHGLAGDKEKALEAGCNDYIAKPINKERLFEIIQNCVNKKSM